MPVTWALKVTLCPTNAGFGETVRAVLVEPTTLAKEFSRRIAVEVGPPLTPKTRSGYPLPLRSAVMTYAGYAARVSSMPV